MFRIVKHQKTYSFFQKSEYLPVINHLAIAQLHGVKSAK